MWGFFLFFLPRWHKFHPECLLSEKRNSVEFSHSGRTWLPGALRHTTVTAGESWRSPVRTPAAVSVRSSPCPPYVCLCFRPQSQKQACLGQLDTHNCCYVVWVEIYDSCVIIHNTQGRSRYCISDQNIHSLTSQLFSLHHQQIQLSDQGSKKQVFLVVSSLRNLVCDFNGHTTQRVGVRYLGDFPANTEDGTCDYLVKKL